MDLIIDEASLPSLTGKTVLITGGGSGIGLAAVRILASKGAKCIVVDRQKPLEALPSEVEFVRCDITSWKDLRSVFSRFHPGASDNDNRTKETLDIAIANAGVAEVEDFFDEKLDEDGQLAEPLWPQIEVNYRATLNFVKLAFMAMKTNNEGKGEGRIVITSSSAGYFPEQRIPVYSSTKAAVTMLVRSLRPLIEKFNITINGVAPTPTLTPFIDPDFIEIMDKQGVPFSKPHDVGLALVYSATATQDHRAENYGKELASGPGPWNGRVILTLGGRFIEIEESLAKTKPLWCGEDTVRLMKRQQITTDFRDI